jgi:hypothetical protein
MTKLAIVAALIAAYMEIGWLGVAAGLMGCAVPYVYVLGFALRHGETSVEIEP